MSIHNRNIDRRIRDALRDHGFIYERCNRHFVFRHIRTGRKIVLSRSPKADGISKVLKDIERIDSAA